MVTYCYYADRLPHDPGGTEVWPTPCFTTLQSTFGDVHAATDAATDAAQRHQVCEEPWSAHHPGRRQERGISVMWTAIWTVLMFVLALSLLLFLGDSILAFAAEQLRDRRVQRLHLERERTKQAMLAHQRDALVGHQLNHVTGSDQPFDLRP
jgi:hypothetical protein